jgi:hypothetical protein
MAQDKKVENVDHARKEKQMVRGLVVIVALLFLAVPTVVEAQWAYLAPPWNFNIHPKYAGKDIQAIPLSEWEQLAAFDSAAQCERARLFGRDIRNLSPNDRERLLALFATGAENRARMEAERPIAQDLALKGTWPDQKMAQESEANTLKWWSASKCIPLR